MNESAIRILFVEDDQVDRRAFERFMDNAGTGHTYDLAGSIGEALPLLKKNKYDVVMLDYLLGDGTAFDLFGCTRGAPIVIITGTGDEEVAVKAMKAGAYDYVIKDSEGHYLKALPATLENVIKRRQSEMELARYRENLETLVRIRTEDLHKEIEERKKAEELVRASLKEKELLLREIHHRVKNNMQIVTSLLNLQAQKATDDRSMEMIKDSENRVRSMALVHENLDESNDFSRIDFRLYINSLLEYLLGAYGVGSDAIRTRVEINDIFLELNAAIPCAQIINELVTNSIKYAFPGGRKGEISIELSKNGAGYVLTISDDGVGIPSQYNIGSATSLGLQLTGALASQLKGTIVLDRSSGTRFTLRF